MSHDYEVRHAELCRAPTEKDRWRRSSKFIPLHHHVNPARWDTRKYVNAANLCQLLSLNTLRTMWAPVSTTAELLCGVRDSADVFGPLKSADGGLFFIF